MRGHPDRACGGPVDRCGRLRVRLRHVAERPAPADRALRRRCACVCGRDRRGHRAGHRRGAARGRAGRGRRRRALVRRRVLEALPGDLAGVRALVARAEEAPDTLPDGLGRPAPTSTWCRSTARSPARAASPRALLAADAVAFTSSSTVTRFAEALAGHDLARVRGVSIGPVTSSTGARTRRRADRRGARARSRRNGRRVCSRFCRNLRKPDALPLANAHSLDLHGR